MKVGVISDTHNYLDPQIPRLFKGVEHILHAGDIGGTSILLDLREIAPVTAVSGNTDDPGMGYRSTEVVVVGKVRFLLHHIVNPLNLAETVQQLIRSASPDVVVFGHTHKPCEMWIGRGLSGLGAECAPGSGKVGCLSRARRPAQECGPYPGHRPAHECQPYLKGQILFLNPGYSGKQRFALPRSVAILHWNSDALRVEFIRL